ncbi:sterol desaturase family protein [Bernardetia sp. Wsw4-3y2]|uniref:sterol desaturase family protein n=1 Tax=Bernardetia sp. Wsw4-3y2 TaxID=3127471 RepID=UPI0030D5AF87
MSFLNILLATGASLIFLALVFIPMEKAFPAKPNQKIFRPKWFLDLCYFVGQYLLWSGLVLKVLSYFGVWIDETISFQFREIIAAQPIWLQSLEVLILSDLLIYWGHRFQHQFDFLWRFHKVHHTTETLDWLAAHREHPIDSIYTVGIINLPALLLGFNLETLAVVVAFRGVWAIYIHSNVRLSIGMLKVIIGSPELHHWHHDKERDRGNYANISPLMDVIFGTYTCPPTEPKEYGIEENFPTTYLGQLLQPILPKRIWQFIDNKTTKNKV